MSQNNINIDELKKMATNISYDQMNHDTNSYSYKTNTSSDDVDKIIQNPANQKRVSFDKNVKVNSHVQNLARSSRNDELDTKTLSETNFNSSTNMWNIFGFLIPSQTFYLFLVLLSIGCAIWYINSPKPNTDIQKNLKKRNDK